MRNTWQLERAKAEFSKLIDTSIEKGPQTVTRHGRPAAVVMSTAEYQAADQPSALTSRPFCGARPCIN